MVAAAPPPTSGAYAAGSGPILLNGTPFGTSTFYIGWYWAVALVGGYLLTLLWYRRHARRAGVWTPARGYLITGVVLTVLARSHLAWQLTALPNVLLPAAILLAAGCVAFLAQRTRRGTA